MKGIIFNLLEEVVTDAHGEAAWDAILEAAGLDGAYTSLGNYPDADVEALVGAAAAILNVDRGTALRWFGAAAMPLLQQRYPQLFAGHAGARSLIQSVNSIIHPEVRKLYSGTNCPFFHMSEKDDGALVMTYASSRKMCALAHGFVEGAGRLWCEEVSVEHAACTDAGHDRCVMELRWAA